MSEERPWARMVDRRGAHRGDARREALLAALDDLLRERTLDEVNVGEVSQRAGVTRSAFYFYFESKAVAVLALMADLYDEASAAADLLAKAEGDPVDRVRRAVTALFDSVDATPHTYRALLEAHATSPAVRDLWEAGRADYAAQVAEMVERERATGRAVAGPPAAALADVLLDLNDRALQRYALGGGPSRADTVDALTHLWTTSLYGSAA